jgi:hypothetical protein
MPHCIHNLIIVMIITIITTTTIYYYLMKVFTFQLRNVGCLGRWYDVSYNHVIHFVCYSHRNCLAGNESTATYKSLKFYIFSSFTIEIIIYNCFVINYVTLELITLTI